MNLLSGVSQDFHREQKSPSAYEWWHFDGTDNTSGFSFSIQFLAGNLFSAYYQDNLKTYWQKTKSPLVNSSSRETIEPPNPLDYCGVAFRIFHKDRLVGEARQEFSHLFLKASDHQCAVLLGPNRFNWDANGDPPSYVLTVQAPVRGGKKLLRARLFFTPQTSDIPNLPAPLMPSTHTWVLSAPVCHVEGTIQWCDAAGEVEKDQGFIGKGYHDHHWGTVPLDRFVKSWHWGRAFMGDKTLVYSIQTPRDENEVSEGIVLEFNKNKPGVIRREVKTSLAKNRRNFFWLPYPKQLRLTDSFTLDLNHDSILSDGPVALILKDQVEWKNSSESLKGLGLSNYLYAPRLSSSFFFPMLKGKTMVYTQKEEIPLPPNPGEDVFTDRSKL